MSDEAIITLFLDEKSRNKAFQEIIDTYQKRIYWHIRKMVISHDDADDATQNTFIKVWKGLENFKENSKLFTWIYRIATHEALNILHARKRQVMTDWESVENNLADSLVDDPYFNGNDLQRRFQQFLLTLPEKQRLVFNMKYFDELTYEEISEIVGTSVGALKASYFHAVKKIEQHFKA